MSSQDNTTKETYIEIHIVFMDDNELLLYCDTEQENAVKYYAAAVPTAPFFVVTDNDDEYYAIPTSWIKYLTSQVVEIVPPVNLFEAVKVFVDSTKAQGKS